MSGAPGGALEHGGWVLDMDSPTGTAADVAACGGGAGWFGASTVAIGSISAVLHGAGTAEVTFGNCLAGETGGEISLRVGGVVLAVAGWVGSHVLNNCDSRIKSKHRVYDLL